MKIAGSVFVITGASAGIGAALARDVVRQGGCALITARRAERLEALCAELAGEPGRCVPLAGDVQQEAFCRAMIARAVEEFGRIDVLVNNAAIGHNSRLVDLPVEHMRMMIDTNLSALMYAVQAAVPPMRSQGSGVIVNISSVISARPLPDNAFYAATKAAVDMLSRGLRIELRADNIRVINVFPGRTRTEFGEVKLGGPTRRRGGISAERAARAIVKGIARERHEVIVTWFDWFFIHGNRLFPRLTDRFFGLLFAR